MTKYKELLLLLFLLIICCFSTNPLWSQSKDLSIAQSISAQSNALKNIPTTRLLSPAPAPVDLQKNLEDEVETASYWRMETSAIKLLLAQPPGLLKLSLPTPANGPMNLQLERKDVFSPEFKMYTASNRNDNYNYEGGGIGA